ncbi:MAG: hypothetical protein R3B09_20510 [Nannocystaceae bacterium]
MSESQADGPAVIVAPFKSDAEHLREALLALDARLLLRVAQLRQLVGRGPPRRGRATESAAVIEHFEGLPGEPSWARASSDPRLAPLEEASERDRCALRARETATRDAGLPLRLDRLGERFGLDALERELLLLAAATDLDARYEQLFGWLHDDVDRRRPSVQLALDLLGGDFGGRLALRERLLDPAAPLRRHDLISLCRDAGAASSARDALIVHPGALRWLCGGPALAPALAAWASSTTASPALTDELEIVVERLHAALAARPGPTQIDLVGLEGVGRTRVAQALAARPCRGCVVVDGARAAALGHVEFAALVDGLARGAPRRAPPRVARRRGAPRGRATRAPGDPRGRDRLRERRTPRVVLVEPTGRRRLADGAPGPAPLPDRRAVDRHTARALAGRAAGGRGGRGRRGGLGVSNDRRPDPRGRGGGSRRRADPRGPAEHR